MSSCVVGIDVGKTHIRAAANAGGSGLAHYGKRAYERGAPEAFEEEILSLIEATLSGAGCPLESLAGVGIALPAAVNRADGTVLYGPDFDFMIGRSMVSRIRERYGVPAVAEADTVMATWGERWAGVGTSCNKFAVVTWGTGIGAGLVLDGTVYEEPNHLFAEFGHWVVSDDDWPCGCGARGCLNALISGPGIARHGRLAVREGKQTVLTELAGGDPENVTCPMVFDAADRGDEVAQSILTRVAVLLGRLCANLVYAIQPEKIVIVGGLAERVPYVLDQARRTMEENCWLIFKGLTACEIVSSQLGDTAGVFGAIRKIRLLLQKGN